MRSWITRLATARWSAPASSATRPSEAGMTGPTLSDERIRS
jgi:hypothetical protein